MLQPIERHLVSINGAPNTACIKKSSDNFGTNLVYILVELSQKLLRNSLQESSHFYVGLFGEDGKRESEKEVC